MRLFLTKIVLFLLLIGASFFWILSQAGGHTNLYVKFSTPKQKSLILGTSRAGQGIQPSSLNSVLGRNDFFNYAFTVVHSPYGPTYLESIKRKLDTSTRDNIFIQAVTPWAISSTSENKNDTTQFRELNLALKKLKNVSVSPNLSYLLTCYDKHYFNILRKKSNSFVHDDGWIEYSIDVNTKLFKEKLERKVADYKENYLPKYGYSDVRMDYLEKTVDYLGQYGKVFLVRLPIDAKILDLENEFMPDFTTKIQPAVDKSSGYYDMTPLHAKFIYTDGNHIHRDSGKEVSKEIGNWIKKILDENQ